MKKFKNMIALLLAVLLVISLAACGNNEANVSAYNTSEQSETGTSSREDETDSGNSSAQSDSREADSENTAISWDTDLARLDTTAWQYNTSDDVYWQVGLSYCSNPADDNYETLGVFVPGAYFNGTKNADGTYTCTINTESSVGSYTAETAPILFPVNTPGHKAQDAPTGYAKGCTSYTNEGFVYVVAGCRGKDAGIPAGVTDLKAAIRYIRYISDSLPGSTDRIAVFGMSGGGSQCAVLGSSGDSELYIPYLQALGAADTSDAVAAVMSWCPITSFDSADLAYEWNMGTTRSGLSELEQEVSDGLAAAYADYVNAMGFVNENGNVLTLEASEGGVYQSGSYYDYVLHVIETSLEHYLLDEGYSVSSAASYVDSLNSAGQWVSYDVNTGKATVSSLSGFAKACKHATKPIAAFDKLDEGGHELFNTGDGAKTHFDSVLYELVKGTAYEKEMAEDLEKTDALGNDMTYRLYMFSPLYYLMPANEGYERSSVASYWRIRTGIEQTDTALTTEINLTLALEAYGAEVDFETVWDQGHTQAERTGKGTENLIAWINSLWS